MKKKVTFDFKHGKIEGIYAQANNPNAPLVIITNGHNGFYTYGMFPYIQDQFFKNGISSFSYNFSHGGVIGDSDYFSELGLYEKNSMRLETEDLCEIVRHLKNSEIAFPEGNKLFFFTHSLGGVPTIFATKKLLSEGYKIDGVVLASTIKTLNVWPKSMIDEWEKNGVYMMKNNRTKQELPQGKEFLEESKQADGAWSLQNALKGLKTNFLIIHGEKDEAVPMEHSVTLNEWNEQYGNKTTLKIVSNGTHTYNTKHPFEGASPELNSMIEEVCNWIQQQK